MVGIVHNPCDIHLPATNGLIGTQGQRHRTEGGIHVRRFYWDLAKRHHLVIVVHFVHAHVLPVTRRKIVATRRQSARRHREKLRCDDGSA